MEHVDEQRYRDWERQVLQRFFTAEQRVTKAIPTDGEPALLLKDKVILVAFAGETLPEDVAAGAADLPTKRTLSLWHIGKQQLDGVSFGLSGSEFKYPGCDLGGLTNCKQTLGERIAFEGEPAMLSQKVPIEELALRLAAAWSRHTSRALPPKFTENIEQWLRSLTQEFNGDVVLRFFRTPAEHRVVVTSADVLRETKAYFVRSFNGPSHAMASDDRSLFCSVQEKYITPNYNEWNILYECRPYLEPSKLVRDCALAFCSGR